MKKIFLVFFFFLFSFLGFFLLETLKNQYSSFLFVAGKNFSIVRFPSSDIFAFGINSSDQNFVVSAVSPFWKKSPKYLTFSLSEKEEIVLPGGSIQKLSDHIFRITHGKEFFLFFDSETNENDFSSIKSVPVPLTASFWVFQKTNLPLGFPPPTKAILFLGERTPGTSLISFALEHKIPLVTIKDTGGFSLSFEKNEWKLRTHK